MTTFMGLTFETNEAVLVPRPETEILARAAIEILEKENATRAIDMCCGSGNLACALAHARPNLEVWAADLTDACVALARKNAARHGLAERVHIHRGDLFAALPQLVVDVIVCNPPYISTGKLQGESAHLLVGQPREAFDAGPYGFAIHRRVIADAPSYLRPNGILAMEIGLGQEKQIESLLTRAKRYTDVRYHVDEAGAPRVVAARLS
jgi:release factor glutamine methyltransferase